MSSREERFETHRPHLLAVATRLMGSAAEAEDAVQEAWLRLDRAGDAGIANLGGWLTTVVSRICLDHLRARAARAEEPADVALSEPPAADADPEDTAILSEATAEALAIVLDTLSPIERVAFVLHDVFDVPFDQIAAIVDRSSAATRQLASRARRRVREATANAGRAPDPRREVVAAFFAAAREGQLDRLIRLLAPEVALRADATATRMGAEPELVGARPVAEWFSGRARAARLAIVDGRYDAAWVARGNIRVVFRFTLEDGQIAAIDLVGDRAAIAALAITHVEQ